MKRALDGWMIEDRAVISYRETSFDAQESPNFRDKSLERVPEAKSVGSFGGQGLCSSESLQGLGKPLPNCGILLACHESLGKLHKAFLEAAEESEQRAASNKSELGVQRL